MLRITDKAKKMFETILVNQDQQDDGAIRIVIEEENTNKLKFDIDQKKDDDFIVKNQSGEILVVYDAQNKKTLDSLVVDYQSEQGFTIKELTYKPTI